MMAGDLLDHRARLRCETRSQNTQFKLAEMRAKLTRQRAFVDVRLSRIGGETMKGIVARSLLPKNARPSLAS